MGKSEAVADQGTLREAIQMHSLPMLRISRILSIRERLMDGNSQYIAKLHCLIRSTPNRFGARDPRRL